MLVRKVGLMWNEALEDRLVELIKAKGMEYTGRYGSGAGYRLI